MISGVHRRRITNNKNKQEEGRYGCDNAERIQFMRDTAYIAVNGSLFQAADLFFYRKL